MKYTDPTGHKQVCERGDEGIEGEFHSSRCGSGATTEQIAKTFDKKHSRYSVYYAQIHEVVKELDVYLEDINTEYEKETDVMRDKRIFRSEDRLRLSINDARRTGQTLHIQYTQDAWKSTKKFPEILGGGYIIDEGSASLGGDTVPGSGEFASYSLSNIVNYYTRTPPPLFFSEDGLRHNPWRHNP